jgi:hypothetical protein
MAFNEEALFEDLSELELAFNTAEETDGFSDVRTTSRFS